MNSFKNAKALVTRPSLRQHTGAERLRAGPHFARPRSGDELRRRPPRAQLSAGRGERMIALW